MTRLYLIQHGAALDKEQDSSRPLSEPGRTDVQAVGALLARGGLAGVSFIHSTKLRARQTAGILAEALRGPVTEVEGLAPKDPVEPWLERFAGGEADAQALVGHQPFVGRLAARLLTGRETTAVVIFEPGAVLCLEHLDDGWGVRWMVAPSLLRG